MPFDFTVYCQYPLCDAVLDEDWKQFCVFHFKEDMAAIESGTDDRNFPMKKWFYQLQGGLCNYCGQHFSIDRLNWEHMKPGGSNAKSNLQLACEPCNRKNTYGRIASFGRRMQACCLGNQDNLVLLRLTAVGCEG